MEKNYSNGEDYVKMLHRGYSEKINDGALIERKLARGRRYVKMDNRAITKCKFRKFK